MLRSNKIMIIDDDPDDIELFCEALSEIDKNIECITASNGEAGLRLLNKPDTVLPDYIFLDLNMPALNGKQCLTSLKANPRLQHIPVIIYTTSKLHEDKEETKKLGAASFITKPSKLSELRKAIASILQGMHQYVSG